MALIDCPSDENFFCYAVCGKEQIIKTNGDSLVFADLIALKEHFKNAILWGEEENQLSVLSISTCDTLRSPHAATSYGVVG